MTGLFRRAACAGGAAALVLCASAAGSAQAARTRPAGDAAAVYTPNPGKSNYLSGVQALSPSNAWAVGDYCVSACYSSPVSRGMILHWNGSTWARRSIPNLANSALSGVTAMSASNAWAVGGYRLGGVVLHWNGTAWKKAVTRNDIAYLTAVSASSVKNVWAVGYGPKRSGLATATLHWNGAKWTKVNSPNPSKYTNMLEGVSVYSATGAWAVGQYCASGCNGGAYVTRGMILHWNGAKWTKAALPVKNSADIAGIQALSATNAWAVGTTATNVLVLHWNGTAWSKVSAPAFYPFAVTFSSASNGWAAGLGPALLRWNGAAWKQVPTSAPSSGYFAGASADSANDAWAVGAYCVSHCSGRKAQYDTLTMHWNGTTWTRK